MATVMTCDYDQKADVMYVSFGGSEPAYFEELSDGIFLARGLFTDKPVGTRIIGYRRLVAAAVSSQVLGQQARVTDMHWPDSRVAGLPLAAAANGKIDLQEAVALG